MAEQQSPKGFRNRALKKTVSESSILSSPASFNSSANYGSVAQLVRA